MFSLRSSSREPVSLFAFQDIVFSVTAIMLFVAICFAISTRVTKFSADTDRDPAAKELSKLTARLAELEAHEAILRIWNDAGQPAVAVTPEISLDSPATLLGGAESHAAVSALRFLLIAEEAEVARHLLTMQNAEAHWSATRRRILEIERQADTILLADRVDDSLLQPVMVLISADWIELAYPQRPDLSRRVPGPVDRTVVLSALRELDPARHLLWLGIRPSGAAFFHTVRAEARAAGFEATYEPIEENHIVNFYSRERALDLLLP